MMRWTPSAQRFRDELRRVYGLAVLADVRARAEELVAEEGGKVLGRSHLRTAWAELVEEAEEGMTRISGQERMGDG